MADGTKIDLAASLVTAWERESGVECVVCPGCAFTFDAAHKDEATGRYSCPCCGYGTPADLRLRSLAWRRP